MKQSIFPHKLTNHARGALLDANTYAQSIGAKSVLAEHLLYTIHQRKGSAGAHILSTIGISAKIIVTETITKVSAAQTSRQTPSPAVSPEIKDIIVRAYKLAGRTGHPFVGTEHLVHALLESNTIAIARIIKKSELKKAALTALTNMPFGDAPLSGLSHLLDRPNDSAIDFSDDFQSEESALEHFCTDITISIQDKILIGRDDIIEDIITTLSRKEKGNPLLVGDPGVGKTAIIEGLAQRIADGAVPAHLMNAQILTLDLASLVAGTTFRGEFESRIKDIISEAEKNRNVILFIDEIHTMIGAGNAQGTLDVANILKPALSRGTIRLIGATTHAEYKKHIAKDAALSRRFQILTVAPPSRAEAITIIRGARSHYESFHGVKVAASLIPTLVDWSIRYIPQRQLPDTAFDILDEASARARMHSTADTVHKELVLLERAYRDVTAQKTTAINEDRYDDALMLRGQEAQLVQKIAAHKKVSKKMTTIDLAVEHIADAVAALAKLPVNKITATKTESLQKSLLQWQKKVVGQKEATEAVKKTLLRSFAGLAPENQPVGSFLFLGPSGVGKTFAATTLADTLFDNPDALIRIDMSEHMERHTTSKLLGAPAGYIGHGEGGTLTEQIRKNPYSVVLFDEIEKAHPDILNILLQILEDGSVTDSDGTKADFRHSVIIMTSNIGTKALTDDTLGFDDEKSNTHSTHTVSRARAELKQTIRPEILDRIDSTIIFTPLTLAALTTITRSAVATLKRRLKKRHITFTAPASVARTIALHAQKHSIHGARGIRSSMHTLLQDPLAEIILASPERPLTVHALVENNDISIVKQ